MIGRKRLRDGIVDRNQRTQEVMGFMCYTNDPIVMGFQWKVGNCLTPLCSLFLQISFLVWSQANE